MKRNKDSRRAVINGLKVTIFLTSFFLWYGCEEEKGLPQQHERSPMAFVESSVGLPETGQWRHGIDFFDMNQDGNLDILAPPPRKTPLPVGKPTPWLWYGNGLGEWTQADIEVPANLPYDYGDVCGGDFDGDGIPDMALAMHTVGVRVLRGKGQGKYEDFSQNLSNLNFRSRALVAEDFDGDGRLDIAANSEAPFHEKDSRPYGVALLTDSSDGWRFRYIAEKNRVKGLFGDQITSGDVNGDGHPDIGSASLSALKNMVIWINDGKGSFTEFNRGLPQEIIFRNVALSDLNGDGKDDLITTISGFGKKGSIGLKAYLTGDEGFEDFSDGLPVQMTYRCVAACDFDNDGDTEIVGGTTDGEIKIYGLQERKWRELKTDGLSKGTVKDPYGLYCVDVNKDGYKDLAVNFSEYGTKNGGIKVFLNLSGEK